MDNNPLSGISKEVRKMLEQMQKPLVDFNFNTDSIKPLLESQQRLQELLGPTIQALYNPALQVLQETLQEAVAPATEIIRASQIQQSQLIDSSTLFLHNSLYSHVDNLSRSLRELSEIKLPAMKIPEELHPYLTRTSGAVQNMFPKEYEGELPAELTVQSPETPNEKPWTWEKLKSFVELVLPLVLTIILTYLNSQQLDQYNAT